jgi:hypothetical protein
MLSVVILFVFNNDNSMYSSKKYVKYSSHLTFTCGGCADDDVAAHSCMYYYSQLFREAGVKSSPGIQYI